MTSAGAGAGHANEDCAGAVPTAAVLIDGAGIAGTGSICRHGVAWYASRLGGSLLSLLSLVRNRSMSALLAEGHHAGDRRSPDTCDVADPISPSATVAILRLSDGLIEHLVLGDSILVLDRADDEPLVVSDPREVIVSRRTGPRSMPPRRGACLSVRAPGAVTARSRSSNSARFRVSRMWRRLRPRDRSGHDGPREEEGEPP
jgi:hypothetical protein